MKIYLFALVILLNCQSSSSSKINVPPAPKNTDGCVSGNCKDGWGTKEYLNGGKYIGNFVDSLPSGDGRFQYPNGEVYSGEFKNGKPHGYGTLYAPNKSVLYTGNWKDGNREE
jgi:antitoxin component YwqK of YwqJK toxin-antitoxin module